MSPSPISSFVDLQGSHHSEMLSLLFCGLPGACAPLTPPCTALGAAGGMVPHFADGDLTLQIDHVIAGETAEGVGLFLTPWTAACQFPLSMQFLRWEY